MAELYNKIGTGLITWSPISLGLCSGKSEDQATLFTKLALKVLAATMLFYFLGHVTSFSPPEISK